jgi:hypothetical protein
MKLRVSQNSFFLLILFSCSITAFSSIARQYIKLPKDTDHTLYSVGVSFTQNGSIEEAKAQIALRLLSTVSSATEIRTTHKNGVNTQIMNAKSVSETNRIPISKVTLLEQDNIKGEWHSLISIDRNELNRTMQDSLTPMERDISSFVNQCQTTALFSCYRKSQEMTDVEERYQAITSIIGRDIHSNATKYIEKLNSALLTSRSGNVVVVEVTGDAACTKKLSSTIKQSLTNKYQVVINNPSAGKVAVDCKAQAMNIGGQLLGSVTLILKVFDEQGKTIKSETMNARGYSFKSLNDAKFLAIENAANQAAQLWRQHE